MNLSAFMIMKGDVGVRCQQCIDEFVAFMIMKADVALQNHERQNGINTLLVSCPDDDGARMIAMVLLNSKFSDAF